MGQFGEKRPNSGIRPKTRPDLEKAQGSHWEADGNQKYDLETRGNHSRVTKIDTQPRARLQGIPTQDNGFLQWEGNLEEGWEPRG